MSWRISSSESSGSEVSQSSGLQTTSDDESDSSSDNYEFEDYTAESYENGNGPSLVTKKARILAATTQNDVETLELLLNSRKWYRVCDTYGNNLLHIAIYKENDEVFDHLISHRYFERKVDTVCIRNRSTFELTVERTNDVNAKLGPKGNTLLHCAVKLGFLKAARMLIEKGADLDAQNDYGQTPLHACIYIPGKQKLSLMDEAVSMLLYYGANPSIRDKAKFTPFDRFLCQFGCGAPDGYLFVEQLFRFTVDESNLYHVPSSSLLMLAHNQHRSFFYEVIKLTSKVIYADSPRCLGLSFMLLITLEAEYLQILLEKFPSFVKNVLRRYTDEPLCYLPFYPHLWKSFDIKNFDTLTQSALRSYVLKIVYNLDSRRLIQHLLAAGKESEIVEIIYYFLSYGMRLHVQDFETIYNITGYSEEYKNLLLMDVHPDQTIRSISKMMPRLIYDVQLDIHRFVKANLNYRLLDWEIIFRYFVHPKIQDVYLDFARGDCKRLRVPQIPLLKELARDAFRKYFIKLFNIRTAKHFYSLIGRLPVDTDVKKIITYESILYTLPEKE